MNLIDPDYSVGAEILVSVSSDKYIHTEDSDLD
jgi:hypothetical protein